MLPYPSKSSYAGAASNIHKPPAVPELHALLPALILLVLGAMSPGPSLAVVVRNTTSGGRWRGLQCAVGHGLGFGLYALAVVFGLAVVIRDAPEFFAFVQVLGGCLLLFLAWQSFRSPEQPPQTPDHVDPGPVSRMHWAQGFTQGFLIAILNPKIALFFLAVFASVLNETLTRPTQLAMALAGWLIDTSWYACVALALSTGPALKHLRRNARLIDQIMALIFVALAVFTFQSVFEFL